MKSTDLAHTNIRIGFGIDVHRLVAGRKLILGGVEVPSELGLDGHSDADVLLHAICDALLGAAALGDIGQIFPNTDQRFKDISSLLLLDQVGTMLSERRFEILNIDATVILDSPKIGPRVEEMRRTIAARLRIAPQQVSVKATTNEGLGFIGEGQGATAHAVVLIRERVQPAAPAAP